MASQVDHRGVIADIENCFQMALEIKTVNNKHSFFISEA